ncbi:MAG: 23S rRNA (guanosine(2251)-2'-O)-methyltransferase RlmB [Verrucomicrobia bacterium]|nr:23S rRNA (guanosine(2251)-2'-O)-methyltransferase RlmB [Verrucomicrobiota bacterium]
MARRTRAKDSTPIPSRRHARRVRQRTPPPRREHGRTARENRHVPAGTSKPALDEDGLMEIIAARAVPFVLILDCIQDPNNLGAILRTADAAGVDVVVAPKDKSVGITETVRRVSVGAADHVPFAQVTNLARTMEQLKQAGLWIVGTTDQAKDRTLYELDLRGPLAIVVGAEEKGMRRLTTEHCDFLASLPMAGHVGCLNASVAAGVCLFEAVRQRAAAVRSDPSSND